MDEPPAGAGPRDPGDRPPEGRRLAEPPSSRYGLTGSDGAPTGQRPRAIGGAFARAALVSVLGAVAIFVLEGLLSVTTGLLAAMAVTGFAIGRALRGAGDALTSSASLALALFLVADAVILGNALTWINAVVAEGGVLGPIEYLSETFGVLIVVELAVGSIAAWVGSRR